MQGLSWNEFLQIAGKVAAEEGYPLAVLAGQAAQETGRDVSNAPGWNFFGIKGPGQTLKTWEDYGNGPVTVNASFRSYNSPEDSIRDYINLIKNNYPQAWALRDNPTAMVQAIKAGGYATDPNYVNAVTNTPEFRQFADQSPIPKTPEQPRSIMETIKDYLVPQAYADSPLDLGGVRNFSYQGRQPNLLDYVVKPGDTLWGIAEQYGLGGQNYNQIKGYSGSPRALPVGQHLQVPNSKGYLQYVQKPDLRGNSTPSNANYSSPSGPAYAPPPQQTYSPKPSQPTAQPSAQLNFSPGKTVKPSNVMDKALTTKSGLKLTI